MIINQNKTSKREDHVKSTENNDKNDKKIRHTRKKQDTTRNVKSHVFNIDT